MILCPLLEMLQLQVLEEEFRQQREEREKFYSVDRPLPKQLRASVSLPDASWDSVQSSSRTRSATGVHQMQEGSESCAGESHEMLDDVVLGLPSLTDTANRTTQNGNT